MYLIINLSRKTLSYSSYKIFLQNLVNEEKIYVANYKPVYDDEDLVKLCNEIETYFYSVHTNNWDLCLFTDMDSSNSLIDNTITAKIYKIRKYIIEPLSEKYNFNNLYCLSLDDLHRNYDKELQDSLAISTHVLDKLGYLHNEVEDIDKEELELLFNEDEFDEIDKEWELLKNTKKSRNNWTEYKEKLFKNHFGNKLDKSKDRYEWYYLALKDVVKDLKEKDEFYDDKKISDFLKLLLSKLVSSYREQRTFIIRLDLNEDTYQYNTEEKEFRNTLKLVSFIMFIATQNIEEELNRRYSPLFNENHWTLSLRLDDNKISKMLNLFQNNLIKYRDDISKINDVKIEYEEYSPDDFNLELNMRMPISPNIPKFNLFMDHNDLSVAKNYYFNIEKRYKDGISYANKRIRNLTEVLRKQREAKPTGNIDNNTLFYIKELKKQLNANIEQDEKIISDFKNSNYLTVQRKDMEEYQEKFNLTDSLLNKRIYGKAVILYSLLLFVILNLFIYVFDYYHFNYKDIYKLGIKKYLVFYFVCIILPVLIFVIIQLIKAWILKRKITNSFKKIDELSDSHINDIYKNDKKEAEYVKLMYDLSMKKKYLYYIDNLIKKNSERLDSYLYHMDHMENCIELSEKLLDKLHYSKMDYFTDFDADGFEEIKYELSCENNKAYCPLNYTNTDEIDVDFLIKNYKQEVNNNVNLGCISRIELRYDKEYKDELADN